MYSEYNNDIEKFNKMYKLPTPSKPKMILASELVNFSNILEEEVDESRDILVEIAVDSDPLKVQTMTADWLGDIIVYCSTQALKFGLPMDKVLKVIMDSNFSKLGADGKPIYDDRGKVMKGPNYWKPEPKIRAILENKKGKSDAR